MVAFIADDTFFSGNFANGPPEIIALPIGIGDVVAM